MTIRANTITRRSRHSSAKRPKRGQFGPDPIFAEHRRPEHGQAEIPNRFVQASREDAVPIVKQVLVRMVKSNDLPQLL
jgi:hypothetical protein